MAEVCLNTTQPNANGAWKKPIDFDGSPDIHYSYNKSFSEAHIPFISFRVPVYGSKLVEPTKAALPWQFPCLWHALTCQGTHY